MPIAPPVSGAPTGHWSFDEGSGTSLSNYADAGLPPGTLTSPLLWATPGHIGAAALLFDGGSYSTASVSVNTTVGGANSVAFWSLPCFLMRSSQCLRQSTTRRRNLTQFLHSVFRVFAMAPSCMPPFKSLGYRPVLVSISFMFQRHPGSDGRTLPLFYRTSAILQVCGFLQRALPSRRRAVVQGILSSATVAIYVNGVKQSLAGFSLDIYAPTLSNSVIIGALQSTSTICCYWQGPYSDLRFLTESCSRAHR